jgi:glycosyltransferase involved in cell wall biosynthesis
MRLAYLTTTYPKPSHTFIRRELVELERRGHHVVRLAIRPSGDALADPADRDEHARTFHCLAQPRARLAWTALAWLATHPGEAWRAAALALAMARGAGAGFVRQAAYLVEAASLLWRLRGERVEHVHVHFGTNPATVARLMRALGGPPYSMTVHGPAEFDDPLGQWLGGKVADSAFTVAISDFASSQLRRWSDYRDWSKLAIVHCGVSQAFFAEPAPLDPLSRTLVCVGRLTPAKGQLLLLDAMAALVDEGLDVQLVLAGDGEMRGVVERRIEELGLEGHVRITGWIGEAEVRKEIAAARALVLPSFAEGLPVVIMEAMAMGRPVISTAIAAIPELVRTGETGWLVAPGNAGELADAMRDAVAASPERLSALAASARQRVRERHDVAREAAKLEALLLASRG